MSISAEKKLVTAFPPPRRGTLRAISPSGPGRESRCTSSASSNRVIIGGDHTGGAHALGAALVPVGMGTPMTPERVKRLLAAAPRYGLTIFPPPEE